MPYSPWCAASAVAYPQREALKPERPARGAAIERFDEAAQALRWLGEESAALPALLAEAAELGLHKHCWQLTWGFAEFMQRRGLWRQTLRAQAVALAAAERLRDRLAQALCHNSIARAHAKLGRDHQAIEHYDQALELHRGLNEPACTHMSIWG
ncbi:tetratricopeptide repeat protein [Nonomuraea sp. B1E8]|uniref:tetratricopeptide repeat protein n=1 Tax=unclassified Nonomuraea TaxID=2593643 RepID=UPI00325EDFA6